MFWRLFRKSVHVKPMASFGPTVDERVMKWGVFNGREYSHLWDDLHRYGWRIALHNLLALLGLPMHRLSGGASDLSE